jgi:polygalacturonase
MDQTGTGVRMKSERGRGGIVEDIVYRRVLMKEIAGQCIQVTLNYAKGLKPTNVTATPQFRNILLEDIHCQRAQSSYFIDGLAEQHVQNLTLSTRPWLHLLIIFCLHNKVTRCDSD